MSYQSVYYRDQRGRQPVREAIAVLAPECRSKIHFAIELLNALDDSNPVLASPHSSALFGTAKGFRELRPTSCGRQRHRIIYRRSLRFFILLHIVEGKEGEVSEADKQIALDRWNDFVERMDAIPTAKPRAMGADAP